MKLVALGTFLSFSSATFLRQKPPVSFYNWSSLGSLYLPPLHAKFPIIPFVFTHATLSLSFPATTNPYVTSVIFVSTLFMPRNNQKRDEGDIFRYAYQHRRGRARRFYVDISCYIFLDHKGGISFRMTRNYLCFFSCVWFVLTGTSFANLWPTPFTYNALMFYIYYTVWILKS